MKIVYTLTDEAPALATHSLLPVLRAFAAAADIEIEVRDISLAGRILAQFPDRLDEDQRVADALEELGELAQQPEANIIKLPNISASVPQLKAAIEELQQKGYAIPDYPEEPKSDEQRDTRARYDKVTGSAVNPVLRQGNSDRRAPASVKEYARQHPHSMGEWSQDSRSHVSTMSDDDFRSTERSHAVQRAGTVRIEHVDADGNVTALKDDIAVQDGEIIDAAVMRRSALRGLPGRADRGRQGARRPVLGAPEDHDDARVRPDHLRPRRPGLLQGPLRAARRRAEVGRGQPERRAGRAPEGDRVPPGRPGRRDQAGDRRGLRERAAAGHGQLRSGDHQPPRAQRRDRRRVDAGSDPLLGPDVEPAG